MNTQRAQSRRIWIACGLLIATGLLAYLNSFQGVFIYDDLDSIRDNPHIRKLWPLTEAMSLPLLGWGETVAGRPMLSLSFALNYRLLGSAPWGYHLVNLVVHIGASLLLFALARRTLGSSRFHGDDRDATATRLALATSLIWLVHPIQTESVTYMVQRAESLMGFSYLLTLYCSVRGFSSKHGGVWYVFAVLACGLGMATKEVMVSAPLIVLLYDRTFATGTFLESLRRRRWLYVGLASTWLFLIPTLSRLLQGRHVADVSADSSLTYLASQPGVILYYLRLAVWPDSLAMHYGWPAPERFVQVILPAAAIVALLVLTARGVYGNRWYGFVGSWFFLILAPSSSCLALAQRIQEHRMYLPLASLVVLAVLGCEHLLRRALVSRLPPRGRRVLSHGLVVVVVIVFGALTVQRNAAYHDELYFWADNVRKRPQSSPAHNNLALALEKRGDLLRAEETYQRSIALNPANNEAHNNLGVLLQRQNRFAEAAEEFKRALALNPADYKAHNNFGVLLQRQNRFAEAAEEFRRALDIAPDLPHANFNLGRLLELQGRIEEATTHYKRAVKASPRFALAHNNLGVLYERQRRFEDARLHYERALEVKPDYAEAHNNLGSLFFTMGLPEQAESQFRLALAINPGFTVARENLRSVQARRHGDPAVPED